MWTSKQFPNMGIGLTPIGQDVLFPFFAEAEVGSSVCISNDGAIVVFFSVERFEREFVAGIIDFLAPSSSVQFYRLRVDGVNHYYGSVKVFIDYSLFKMKFVSMIGRFFVGCDDLLEKVVEETAKTVSNCLNILDVKISTIVDAGVSYLSPIRESNMLYDFLVDYGIKDDELCLNFMPEADVSLLRVAKERFLGVFSLNNVDIIGNNRDVLGDLDFLQVFSVLAPSHARMSDIREYFYRAHCLFDVLDSELEDGAESIVINYKPKDLCFFSNSLFLGYTGKNINVLSESIKDVREKLRIHGLATYQHINSAGLQYVSVFPSNAEFGYYYNIDYREKMVDSIQNFIGL